MRRPLGDNLRALQLETQIQQTLSMLQRPQDRQKLSAILAELSARQETEDDSFARSFQARLDIAKDVVLREHLRLGPDQPLHDQDRPTSMSTRLVNLAEARVYSDHEQRKSMHEEDALDALKHLCADLRARDAPSPSNRHRHDPSPDGSPKRRGPRRA